VGAHFARQILGGDSLLQRSWNPETAMRHEPGGAYFQLHRYADSADAFEQPHNSTPKLSAVGNLGDAYYWARTGAPKPRQPMEKASRWEKKTPCQPARRRVLSSLAMYHAMRETKAALDNLEGALRLNPKNQD